MQILSTILPWYPSWGAAPACQELESQGGQQNDQRDPDKMMTGNEGSRHRAYAEMLGVKEYLRKPFALDRMLKAVRQSLIESGFTLPEADAVAVPNPDEEELI